MVCEACGHENAAGLKFCTECGRPLGAVKPSAAVQPESSEASGDHKACPRCQAASPSRAAFCRFCGYRYGDAGQAMPPQSMPVGALGPTAPPPSAARPAVVDKVDDTVGRQRVVPASEAPGGVPRSSSDARIVAIQRDGTDGESYQLGAPQTDLGRTEGDIRLPDDPYLSPRHLRLFERNNSWFLRDLDSINGTYVRIREPVTLRDGDMILVGQQVLRFERLGQGEEPAGPACLQGVLAFGTPEVPRFARLTQYTTEGVGRDVHYLYRDETVLGRENGDIVFTDDPFLSRRHASIQMDRSQDTIVLRDLGSSNGTAIRFVGERPLEHRDEFRVGRHLFRFERVQQPMRGGLS